MIIVVFLEANVTYRLFFNILHPPLNVPALGTSIPFDLSVWERNWFVLDPLAVSLDEDVDTNKELVAHGYSNILAGLFGVVYVDIDRMPGVHWWAHFQLYRPNYLVYVNTLLFYRVGGTTRISGFLLALATFVLLIVGTAPIGYIRKWNFIDIPSPFFTD